MSTFKKKLLQEIDSDDDGSSTDSNSTAPGYEGLKTRTRFNNTIPKLFKSAIGQRGKAKVSNFKDILLQIRYLIEESEFEYDNSDQRITSTQVFVDLWAYLLSIVYSLPYDEKKLVLEIIIYTMKRREFDPINLSNRSSKRGKTTILNAIARKDAADPILAIATKYKQLLYETQLFAIGLLRRTARVSMEVFIFCANVFAINFFRILRISDLIPFIATVCKYGPVAADLDSEGQQQVLHEVMELINEHTSINIPLSLNNNNTSSSGNCDNTTLSRNNNAGESANVHTDKSRQIFSSLVIIVTNTPFLFNLESTFSRSKQ
eukprot:GEZU01024070.1.p1 GENE.GEZU01024070.1~~GEZU01024070.1.p1  ORF type:complete len:319 (-),score=64.00 GEZU01024070.1:164-1120(-)